LSIPNRLAACLRISLNWFPARPRPLRRMRKQNHRHSGPPAGLAANDTVGGLARSFTSTAQTFAVGQAGFHLQSHGVRV